MHRIEWTKKALKQLKALDIKDQGTIYAAVGTLASWPDCRNVKALVDRENYRLRVGRYRVLFAVHDGIPRVIKVQEVKKRDERTY